MVGGKWGGKVLEHMELFYKINKIKKMKHIKIQCTDFKKMSQNKFLKDVYLYLKRRLTEKQKELSSANLLPIIYKLL